MYDASDALGAHIRCRSRLLNSLKQPPECVDYIDVKPHSDCLLMRFADECEAHHPDWPEVRVLRAVHTSLHALVTELARRRMAGEAIDIDAESAPHGRIGQASNSVQAAVWRLERRLHSLAT